MRQGSDRMRGDTGPQREERPGGARDWPTATSCNRSRSSFSTSRDRYDMRWDYEAERCDDLGRMRSHTEPGDDELAETAG
jgi:hypothetical protein